MVLSLLSSRNISYNIQGQSGWWRTVPMPSLSLGTFSPTHFFHPLLRATHSIESQKSCLLGRPSLGTNCPSKCLRIVFINQTLEFSPLPSLTRKVPGLPHGGYTVLTGLKPTIKGRTDNCTQRFWMVLGRISVWVGCAPSLSVFFCASLGGSHKLSPVLQMGL